MNDIYSFYQLISKYQIEIPIIQRDYAQGRENAKAADVRKSLVSKMIDAVKNSEPLFFDFVYGRVDDNKFIPFDGQQRLTTLFLFHKYVFEKCQSESGCNHKDNCSCRGILGRFSYATRQSSREFCEKLVQEKIISGISLTDNIKNQSWFYPDWEKDPTVMGMLTMLDEIHCQMRNEADFKTFAEKLTSGCNCPITFHFVDMGEHKLSDETYVKMNARGKQLTPFENFKASLEQYLKAKNSDLLSSLEGKYDSSQEKYTGIDGTWLDLFWNVANEGKTEKELPDTLMMSFFNRHFMNVWRCWYANTEENKDVDVFNTRIQKEMPLYPTKDDFVSFDIYQGIIEKCGIDKCLTPLFNICDALCEKDNSIKKDCQAVWNRDKEKLQWNLYYGDKNNNNRETYPSRVAFYALMKYFATDFKRETRPTPLSQWMRVVWNIIENSTIDSSEPYHAALRLIEKLSAKCSTIYNSLANEFDNFELGNQYHAKEQVAEEIAKAKQILDKNGTPRKYEGKSKKKDETSYDTWEDIIIDAEKTAFFKGAIRFLFTKEYIGDDWEHFDTKWINAQEYFDKNGVKDGKEKFKSNALLMKSLMANCDDFWNKIWRHFEFSNDAVHWKRILVSNNWKNAVDAIMGTGVTIETTKKSIERIREPLIKNIVDDELMDYVCNNMPGAWMRRTYHNYHAIWQSGYPSYQIVLNPILAQLKFDNIIDYCKKNSIENCRYYKCVEKNVDFKYNNHYFQWWGNPNEKQLDVYLMEDDWADYKKRPNPSADIKTDEDMYYCFRVYENTTTESFKQELEKLIAQA